MKSTPKKHFFRVEREFGLIVGVVFLLLGAWWVYRGKFPDAARALLLLGGGLVLLGAVFPRALVYPNKAWMKLAEALSFVMTQNHSRVCVLFHRDSDRRDQNDCSVGTRLAPQWFQAVVLATLFASDNAIRDTTKRCIEEFTDVKDPSCQRALGVHEGQQEVLARSDRHHPGGWLELCWCWRRVLPLRRSSTHCSRDGERLTVW